MIIRKIEIEGFGKFTDVSFEFDKGMNLIYGNNEDGKTTLMSFVKMMLYSSSAKTEKSADLFKALRKKYRPWNASSMSGAIEFESNGMSYRMQKEFLKSDATDKTTIFCISTGENIQIENKNDPGEYFLGMTVDEFERSVFMGQSGGFTADNTSDRLAMRISNLSVSGDESISHEQISKRLYDAAEELVSKSRKKGLLVDANARLEQLKEEKQQLIRLEDEQKDIETKILHLTEEINNLEADLNILSDHDRLENAKKELSAYYTLSNKLNLLKAVKSQLSSYNASYEDMEKYAQSAKILNDKIEHNHTLIQEATLAKDKTISDEDYVYLMSLEESCNSLRRDMETVYGRISSLYTQYQDKVIFSFKRAKLISFAALTISLILAAAAFFVPPYGTVLSLILIFLGTGIFTWLFATAKTRSFLKLDVQLAKRDYEGAVRSIERFSDEYTEKSPDELVTALGELLAESASKLDNYLNQLGISDISELKSKSGEFKKENIKAITDELAVQKEDFVALSCTIMPCANFSAAKILYVELCESLSKDKSIRQEIETICHATGIQNTDEDFVANRLKELGEVIKNAPIRPSENKESIPEIRKELSEKRNLLSQLQAQIKRPSIGMSELLEQIKTTRKKADELKQRYDEICIAIEVMNEAVLYVGKGLGSHLSQKTGQYISKISKGKYNDVLVPRDLSLEARAKGSQSFHEWKYLSTGAIDKIYFALRLAMTDILAENHDSLPLFLDDIFAQYDDKSIKASLIFLKEYIDSSNAVSQVMFFTCHQNILEMAKDIFSDCKKIIL